MTPTDPELVTRHEVNMPNKSYAQWEATKRWCLAHPGQDAAVAMIDGHFTLVWHQKPTTLRGEEDGRSYDPDLGGRLRAMREWALEERKGILHAVLQDAEAALDAARQRADRAEFVADVDIERAQVIAQRNADLVATLHQAEARVQQLEAALNEFLDAVEGTTIGELRKLVPRADTQEPTP